MRTKFLVAVLGCTIQPVMAMPLDQTGAAVTFYSNYSMPDNATGGISGGYCTSNCSQDVVYEYETRDQGGTHGDHTDLDVTRRAQYASDSHRVGVNTMVAPLPGVGQYIYSGEGHGDANYGGYADAGAMRMGAHAQAETNQSGAPAQAQASSAVRNQVTVKAGNSGLSDGDLVRMRWNLRLDGSMAAGGYSSPTGSTASSIMDANFAIETPSTDGGEASVYTLASFRSQASLAGGDVAPGYGGYAYSSSWNYRFIGSTNTGADYFSSDYGDFYGHELDTLYSDYLSVDSGLISLEFDAIIGSTLDLIGTLDVFTYVNQTGYAYGNFLNTFSNSVVSTVDGVELEWLIMPSAPTGTVPEPASLALLGVGLLGMISVGRRRTADHLTA